MIDHARPWTIVQNYGLVATEGPIWWHEDICAENNVHVVIGKDNYFLSVDGLLMPAKKGPWGGGRQTVDTILGRNFRAEAGKPPLYYLLSLPLHRTVSCFL